MSLTLNHLNIKQFILKFITSPCHLLNYDTSLLEEFGDLALLNPLNSVGIVFRPACYCIDLGRHCPRN